MTPISAEDLMQLEREGWIALCSSEGALYYREHLADSAVMAFSFGVLTREQALEAMASAPPWAEFEISDSRMVEMTADSAMVVYTVDAQRPEDPPYSAVISSAFVRAGGTWKLAFHQQTPR